jgi:hypothetical protein
MKTPYQPKKPDAFGNKGGGSKEWKTTQTGFEKNISFSSAFVNFPSNMSYTPVFGSKRVHTIFNTWGPKMSNNRWKAKT